MGTGRHIFLYGPPGAGKTTTGRLFAARLELDFLDLDAHIERTESSSVAQLMSSRGEAGFRDLESASLEAAIKGGPKVIALGGGALLRPGNRKRAEANGIVACLTADEPVLRERLRADGNGRPLLAGDTGEKLGALLKARRAHYESFELHVPTDGLSPAEVCRLVQVRLGRFRVRGMGAGYDVIVQSGGLDRLRELIPQDRMSEAAVIVSDENVAPLYAPSVARALSGIGESKLITIPAGEGAKRLETVKALWEGFLEAGLDRRGAVLALGGGVVGDLAGFAASTYLRGIDWICLPTSLLAMVDASLGGKTGFDLAQGKNLVGTFHAPAMVLADPSTLATLPEAELRAGLAEVVKHGVIADPGLFDLCAAGFDQVRSSMAEILPRAMAVKVDIIEADPYEGGARAALNFGHTVGHALEQASGYCMRHGEAVAIGMVAEAGLAERLGLAEAGLSERIAGALTGLGLPVDIPAGLSRADILRAMQADKKRSRGSVRLALPEAIGRVRTGIPLEDLDGIFMETT